MLLAWPGTGWDWMYVCVGGVGMQRMLTRRAWEKRGSARAQSLEKRECGKTRITRAPTRETNLIVKSHLQIAVHREMGETKSTQKQAKMSFSLKALSILL